MIVLAIYQNEEGLAFFHLNFYFRIGLLITNTSSLAILNDEEMAYKVFIYYFKLHILVTQTKIILSFSVKKTILL